MHVQEHDPEEDSLGTVLYDAGMDEERVSMWQHAERMVLLGEGLSDYIEELRSRHRAPEDVWDMILCAAHESGRYQAATMCMQEVAEGDLDPDDPQVSFMMETGVEAARSFYAWHATAIEAWTARRRAPI